MAVESAKRTKTRRTGMFLRRPAIKSYGTVEYGGGASPAAGFGHVRKAPTGGFVTVRGPVSTASRSQDDVVRTDLVTHIKNLVSSFKVAVEEPSSATTVGMRFTLDLHGADTGLEDVTRIVRDELKTVVVPDRWQKLMELQFDDAQPGKVRFKLALEPPAEMRGAGDRTPVSTPDAIELETETGNVTHTLPLSLDRDTVGSVEVSEILSAAGKPNRALANSKRKANQLLGFKVGNQYLYPTFQFDREHKRIKPMALYANVAMECDLDPWGTLDWWFTEDHLLDGQSPVERLAAGTLSEHDIDRMIAHDRMGMD